MFLFSESKFFRSCNWQCFCHTLTAAELAPWTAQPLGEGLQGNRDKGVCTERTGVDFVLLITLQPLATSWVNKAMNSMVVACCSDLWAPVTVFPQPQVPSPPGQMLLWCWCWMWHQCISTACKPFPPDISHREHRRMLSVKTEPKVFL